MRISWREHWEDWKLRRKHEHELAELKTQYVPEIDRLRGDERESAISAYLSECHLPQAELDHLDTKYLKAEARVLGIEIPKDVEWWESDDYHRSSYLTDVGKTRLSKLIRLEKWERTKRILDVTAIIVTTLTGLLGTVIGVLALLYKQ